jgi:group I intron endonuclease
MDCESGIYKILNTENGKMYVGSSINLKRRREKHFSQLKNNRHPNSHLQGAYNKYNKEKFEWIILEYVPDNSIILQREQYWIDFFKSYNREAGYNLAPIAGNCLGAKWSEESKIKRSITRKALHLCGEKSPSFGKHRSEEQKKEMSIMRSGEKSHSALLTNDQVKEIKRMIMDGLSNTEIGNTYGVSRDNISHIKTGLKWSSVIVEGISAEDLRFKNNKSGSDSTNSRLTKDDVIKIKIMLLEGNLYNREIGLIFNVSKTCIASIDRGITYKSVIIPEDYISTIEVA